MRNSAQKTLLRKHFFCPKISKKCVNRDKSKNHDKIAYVRAYNFRPSPNFSAKGLGTFVQLLPPWITLILMTTLIILKFICPRLITHFLFGARGNCKKWLNPLVQRQSQLQSHGKFLPFLQFSMDTFWISSEVHVFKPKLESCYQIDFQPYSHSEYFMSGWERNR